MNNRCDELIAQFTALRKQRKITQREVSEQTGIAQSNIAHMERGGREPQLSTIIRLFDAVGYELKPILKK